MVIDVSVEYNGGFLPDIIMLTLCYAIILPWGNPFKCHEEFLPLQRKFRHKRFDILFPPP